MKLPGIIKRPLTSVKMKLGEYLCKSFTFMISLLAHDHGYVPVIQYVIFTSLTTVYYENSACTHYSKTSLGT